MAIFHDQIHETNSAVLAGSGKSGSGRESSGKGVVGRFGGVERMNTGRGIEGLKSALRARV
jgi:hypothetical protein